MEIGVAIAKPATASPPASNRVLKNFLLIYCIAFSTAQVEQGSCGKFMSRAETIRQEKCCGIAKQEEGR